MEEDPPDRCLDPAGGISGLRPCIIRGVEESLGGAAKDDAEDTFGGAEICWGVDSDSGTTEDPGADGGDSAIARVAASRGGVVSLARDADTAADLGGVFITDSLAEEAISGC